jgi:biopolymer transport protein TolR
MGMSNNYDSDAPMASINVTPLVDVMLVLLVIFMVTAPMMQQGVEVDLPKATTAPLKSSTEQIVLSIDKAGALYLGGSKDNRIEPEALGKKVQAIMAARKEEERKIYIQADTALPYGSIMEVMAKLHDAGIYQIGLVSAAVTEKDRAGKAG